MAALKVNKTEVLEIIAKSESGFMEGDIYPSCFDAGDGKIHRFPNPNAKTTSGIGVRTIRDAAGKNYGKEIFGASQKPEGRITEVHYVFSRPGDAKPSTKISFVTRVGDLGCGIDYYT